MAKPHKQYNGHIEFTHEVHKGQSLLSILHHYQAMGYPVKRWEPIYLLTQRRTGLWKHKGPPQQHDNPNMIYPGDLLVLPRSREGYNLAIARTKELLRDVVHEPSEVQEIKKEADEFGERLDLFSDVVTLVVTCGVSAVSSLKEAESAVGLAAKLKWARAHGLWEEIAEKIGDFAAEKLSKYGFGDKGEQGAKAGETAKKAKEMYEVAKVAKTAKDAVLMIGRGVDILITWISPSKIAKAITHFDRAIKKAGEQERSTRAALERLLHGKIAHLSSERHLLYGTS